MTLINIVFSDPFLFQGGHLYDIISTNIQKGNDFRSVQVILTGTLTGVQDDIRCKVLAALSTVK